MESLKVGGCREGGASLTTNSWAAKEGTWSLVAGVEGGIWGRVMSHVTEITLYLYIYIVF